LTRLRPTHRPYKIVTGFGGDNRTVALPDTGPYRQIPTAVQRKATSDKLAALAGPANMPERRHLPPPQTAQCVARPCLFDLSLDPNETSDLGKHRPTRERGHCGVRSASPPSKDQSGSGYQSVSVSSRDGLVLPSYFGADARAHDCTCARGCPHACTPHTPSRRTHLHTPTHAYTHDDARC
jgi:hypothetical protein